MSDTSGVKLIDLLSLKRDGLKAAVEQHLRETPKDAGTNVAWGFVKAEAADGLRRALDCDAFEVLARAWSTAHELHEYADTAKHPPGETAVVHLGDHQLTTCVEPVLTLRVGAFAFPPLRLTLELTAHFQSAALSIRDGRIVAAGVGECSVKAQLKYGDIDLPVGKETPALQLPGRISFDPGLKIG